MSARNIRSTATSTSVTRSIVPFLSIVNDRPKCAICRSPACTTASMAVARRSGSSTRRRTSGAGGRGLNALHHPDFHAAFRRPLQLHVVHEVADQEDAAAARLEEVLGIERVRDRLGVEPFALVAHANQQ